jgi:hypothetical protein
MGFFSVTGREKGQKRERASREAIQSRLSQPREIADIHAGKIFAKIFLACKFKRIFHALRAEQP